MDRNNRNTVNESSKPLKRDKRNIISIIVVFICVFGIISSLWSNSQFTSSTHERTALTPGASAEMGYYTDFVGWINDERALKRGFERFFSETGVQPYVYITNTVVDLPDPTQQQLDEFAGGLYGELFPDEAHLLLVIYTSGSNYLKSFSCGMEAASVIDIEAEHIIKDYLDKYLSYNTYTKSEALSQAFSSAATRMMSVTYPSWVTVIVLAGVAAIVIVLYVRRRKKQRAAEDAMSAQQVEKLLLIPL